MISPLSDPGQPFGVTDDVMVANDILAHELAAAQRGLARAAAEKRALEERIGALTAKLDKMQAVLDAYALALEE